MKRWRQSEFETPSDAGVSDHEAERSDGWLREAFRRAGDKAIEECPPRMAERCVAAVRAEAERETVALMQWPRLAWATVALVLAVVGALWLSVPPSPHEPGTRLAAPVSQSSHGGEPQVLTAIPSLPEVTPLPVLQVAARPEPVLDVPGLPVILEPAAPVVPPAPKPALEMPPLAVLLVPPRPEVAERPKPSLDMPPLPVARATPDSA